MPLDNPRRIARRIAEPAQRSIGPRRSSPSPALARPSIDESKILLPHVGDSRAPILVVFDPVIHPRDYPYAVKNDELSWLKPRLLEFAQLDRDDIQFVASARSLTFEVNGSDKAVTAHLKQYEDAFIETVRAISPRLIVPMGARACRQILGKAVQITKVRGSLIPDTARFGNIPVLPLLSPFYARRHPENEALFCADLETLGRVVSSGYSTTGVSDREDMAIEWCYDIQHVIDAQPAILSVDVESVGLNPFKEETQLLTVQLTYKSGEALVIPIDYDAGINRHHRFIDWIDVCRKYGIRVRSSGSPGLRIYPSTQRTAHAAYRARILRQLKTLLENPRVGCIGQNLKFDWLYLYYKAGIEIANYLGDTLLMAHLLDENMRTKSIDDLARIYLPSYAGYNDALNRDAEHQGKSRMDLLTPEKMLRYSGGDTIVAFALYNRLLPILKADKKLYACYVHTVMRGIRGFCYVELNGFTVNVKALREFETYLAGVQEKARAKLLSMIPDTIKDKWRNSGVGLKPDRQSILIDYLYEHPDGLRLTPRVFTKQGRPSVSTKQAMPFYVEDNEFVRLLVDYTKNQKMLSTYVKGFYKYIVNGKIRPTFQLHVTTTGRTSSRDPNGQNFPKRGAMAKIFRRIFQAPPGWVYGQNDLSQAELRIAAMISGDEHMMQVYIDGGDIHRATAAGIMGLSIAQFLELDSTVQYLKRYQAKAVNFGFLYGMWWKKFKSYAKTDYNVEFTDAEAEHIREMFFETYPRLLEWHRRTEQFVRKHKYVRAFNGRIRHLPMVDSPDESIAKQAIRQAINSPVQSFGSDIGLMAIGLIMPYLRRTGMAKYIKVCGFIHDSIVYLVREDKAALAARTIKKFMENLPYKKWFGWEPTVPMVADVELGRNLSDTYECKPRHYSKESGNRTFKEIEAAVLREDLESARKKMNSLKSGKDQSAYADSVSSVHKIEDKLGLPRTRASVLPARRGRLVKSTLRAATKPHLEGADPGVAFSVRKLHNRLTSPERAHEQDKASTGNRKRIRRVRKAS